ncbi:thiamine phosphate synthase [Paenibacillus allorhizosphaerae]|uniref:Thiamine-phosphate synthase n=1 Tax=Paenibacillus allorhizosphaerae TaxID=2849866 RepID=A0ABN7TH21_9BACL|nr:thiamine phosphate synthase [Paenibacillus allorhizosphaerae]CAG7622401.1 Thiamine-phosphate synthase [Paenibacillus allorhizosphaerae]
MFKDQLRDLLPLYLVTDLAEYEGKSALHTVREALRGGVTMVQLREKKAQLRDTLKAGAALRELCREYGVPFIVNDRVDVAMLLEADGVHVGQDDLPAREARKLLGDDKIIGVSAGTMEEAEWAMEQGADYLGVGAVYATLTKGDAGAPIGTGLIAQIKDRWPHVCMVGIGGIQPHNSYEVIAAGADGVAVVSAITRQADPKQAAETLLRHMKGIT